VLNYHYYNDGGVDDYDDGQEYDGDYDVTIIMKKVVMIL